MANKLVPEVGSDGKETGKYVPVPATLVDYFNIAIPLDSSGTLIRVLGGIGIALVLSK